MGGISGFVERASERHLGDGMGWPLILLLAVMVGPIAGVFGVYISGWLLRVTGRWLGGRATPGDLRAALAWPNIPALAVLLLLIPGVALLGQELFTRATPMVSHSPGLRMILSGFVLAQTALGAWTLVLCLSAVQGFSAWRALGNLCLAGLAMVMPVLLTVAAVRLSA